MTTKDSVSLDLAIATAWEACKDVRELASKRQLFELGFLRGRVHGSKETGDLALTTLQSAYGTVEKPDEVEKVDYQEGDLEKFFGCDPDFTGDQTTEEFIDEMRGREEKR